MIKTLSFLIKALKPFSSPIKASLAKPVSFYYRKIHPDLLERALTVFVYHDISDKPSEFSRKHQLNVPPALFDYQLGFIKDVFNIISPDDLLDLKIPPKAALITFDDGFRSFFRNALPILKLQQISCVIFLNMGPIKGEMFWAGLISYLCQKRPDFVEYLKGLLPRRFATFPLFLQCSKNVVNRYLEKTGEDFATRVAEFTGEFARESDLSQASIDNVVYYGNHLYNHYVPGLMEPNQLLEAFRNNSKELEKYPNYRNVFSFPFGQPGTCFSGSQVDLLLENGAQKVFRSSGSINFDPNSAYLDRIALTTWNNEPHKIWFQVYQKEMYGKV